MPSIEQSGTITADGTEQTLATVASNRSLLLVVDPTDMFSGDRIVVRAKRKVLSSSSLMEFQSREISGAQSGLVVMDPITSPHEAVFTLEQTGGTFRDFEYSVESL